MRASFGGDVLVSEGSSGWNRALRYVRYTVHIRGEDVMLTMPMHRGAPWVQHVDQVYYYLVALADLQSRRILQTHFVNQRALESRRLFIARGVIFLLNISEPSLTWWYNKSMTIHAIFPDISHRGYLCIPMTVLYHKEWRNEQVKKEWRDKGWANKIPRRELRALWIHNFAELCGTY